MERLLAIDGIDLEASLDQASDLVVKAILADKVDIFLYVAELQALVAMGISDTPLATRERELGLNILPLDGGGLCVEVFRSQQSFISGHAVRDPDDLPLRKRDLGVLSVAIVPLYVGGELRGVLQADSTRPGAFSEYDLRFLEAVAGWVGTITQRVELIDQVRREAIEEARRSAASELVTLLAHDLGNYITPLMGRADLMRHRAEREGRADYLKDATAMGAAVGRLDRIIQNLLDSGRLEQHIFVLDRQVFDLTALVRSTANAFSSKDCRILVYSPTTVWSDGDPARLRQALENLLANAIKHSQPGATVAVSIAMVQQADGDWATIAVQDRGSGIDPAFLPQLFRRFAPGPGSSGLGLGLYLAEGIARAHGGTLTVQSTRGAGSCFSLALPIVAAEYSH